MTVFPSRLVFPVERRRTNRLRRRGTALVVLSNEAREARLVDVTAAGLFSLRTHTRLPIGRTFKFYLRSADPTREIRGRFDVRWAQRSGDGSAWLCGGRVEADEWAAFVHDELSVRGDELIRKRDDVRLRYHRKLVCVDDTGLKRTGSLVDVSPGGARLFVGDPVRQGTHLRINIRGWLTVGGTVVRVRENDMGYEVGVCMESLPEEERARLLHCLSAAWALGARAAEAPVLPLRRRHPRVA